jgi:SAM-dependent methyltransferase
MRKKTNQLVTTVERTNSPEVSASIGFRCNICGDYSRSSLQALRSREAVSCTTCRSTLRFRAVINGLSIGLFGKQIALPDFPIRPDLKGVGLSDSDVYANGLKEKFTYTNTFLHTSPQLDITNIDVTPFRNADFVIASAVFEHVRPPVDIAFKNVRRLLKTGGVFVFSVPYVPGSTVEHFPDLHDYKIDSVDGGFVLTNRTVDGRRQEFRDLVFHGGPGATLEMRLFGLTDLVRHFQATGFDDPTVLSFNAAQFGIDFSGEVCSIPMIARASDRRL